MDSNHYHLNRAYMLLETSIIRINDGRLKSAVGAISAAKGHLIMAEIPHVETGIPTEPQDPLCPCCCPWDRCAGMSCLVG